MKTLVFLAIIVVVSAVVLNQTKGLGCTLCLDFVKEMEKELENDEGTIEQVSNYKLQSPVVVLFIFLLLLFLILDGWTHVLCLSCSAPIHFFKRQSLVHLTAVFYSHDKE